MTQRIIVPSPLFPSHLKCLKTYILPRCEDYLCTDELQFGFNHGFRTSEAIVWLLFGQRTTIQYFTNYDIVLQSSLVRILDHLLAVQYIANCQIRCYYIICCCNFGTLNFWLKRAGEVAFARDFGDSLCQTGTCFIVLPLQKDLHSRICLLYVYVNLVEDVTSIRYTSGAYSTQTTYC